MGNKATTHVAVAIVLSDFMLVGEYANPVPFAEVEALLYQAVAGSVVAALRGGSVWRMKSCPSASASGDEYSYGPR